MVIRALNTLISMPVWISPSTFEGEIGGYGASAFSMAEISAPSGPFNIANQGIFGISRSGVTPVSHSNARDLGGEEAFLQDIAIVVAYLNIGQKSDEATHQAAATRIARRLDMIADGKSHKYQRVLNDNYNRFNELDRVVKHVNLVVWARFAVKAEEDGKVKVSKRAGNNNTMLRKAYEKFTATMFPEYRGTTLLSQILSEIQEYADEGKSCDLVFEREATRVLFYEALFTAMLDVFKVFDVPAVDRPKQAAHIVRRFAELRELSKDHQVLSRSIRRVWSMGIELNGDKFSTEKAKTLLKRFYALADEEFNTIMDQIPNRYIDIICPFLVARLDLWDIPVYFKEAVGTLGVNLSAAESAFEEATTLLNVSITNELLEGLSVKAVTMATYKGAGNRDKEDMMAMIAWRHVILFAELARHDWDVLRKCLAGSFGITEERVDELFSNVSEDVYKLHLARSALLHIKNYDAPNRMKEMVIDRGVARLRGAIARTRKVLALLPEGEKVGDDKMESAVAAAIINLPDIDYDDRQAVGAMRPLIGDDALFGGFSATAVKEIEGIGVDLYFGSFYPQVYGLPQPLIEANINYLAKSKANYNIKFDIHNRRAGYFRQLLGVIDERLARETMDEENRQRIRSSAVGWITNEAMNRKQIFVEIMREQIAKWLDRSILSDDTSWADVGWEIAIPVIGRYHTTKARVMLAESAPKKLQHPVISEAVARYVVAYASAAPAGITRYGLSGRFYGRLNFYLNVLKEIDAAFDIVGLEGEKALSLAMDILRGVEAAVANMVEVKAVSTSRRLVRSEMTAIGIL